MYKKGWEFSIWYYYCHVISCFHVLVRFIGDFFLLSIKFNVIYNILIHFSIYNKKSLKSKVHKGFQYLQQWNSQNEGSDCSKRSIFSAIISWWEQASMKLWWCLLSTRGQQLDFYSARSLKQQSAGRHIAQLGNIIQIASQWSLLFLLNTVFLAEKQ